VELERDPVVVRRVRVEHAQAQPADVEQVGGVIDDVVGRGRLAVPHTAGPVVGCAVGGGVVLIEVGENQRAVAGLAGLPEVFVFVIER
jgi:hypothetical protein